MEATLLALGLSFFAGAQCDAPAVEDGSSFESSCSVRPLAGAALRFRGPGRLRLEAEGQFSRRSFRSPAFVTDTSVRADFLEMAPLGVFRFRALSARWSLGAVAGPQVGFRLRARRRFRDVDEDVTSQLREADLKGVFGVRLTRSMGPAEILLEGRFVWGWTDLDDTGQHRIAPRTWGVRVGFAR